MRMDTPFTPLGPDERINRDGEELVRKGPGTYSGDGVQTRDDPVGGKRVRWRDLPRAEQIRRTVEAKLLWLWEMHGRLPTVAYMANYAHMTENDVKMALADAVTIANLRARGAIPPDADDWEQATGERVVLAGKQVDAVRRILQRVDPDDDKSMRQALQEVDVTVPEWNGWMRDPLFASFVRDSGARLFGDHAHAVDIALLRQAVSGDVGAIKLVLEVTGRLKKDGGVDTGMLLARVIEVLVRHLPPAQLGPIVTDLETLAGTLLGTPAGQQPALGPIVLQDGSPVPYEGPGT